VARALRTIEDSVDLADVQRLLIKPNFVSVERQLAATHVGAVRAVLDFVRARYDGTVIVAEGAAVSPTREGFHRFDYESLVDAYGVELLDLNADETVPVLIYDRRLRPLTVSLARTAVEADYRIAVGPPKTHDVVVVTLSIKNMVMGALVNPGVASNGGGILHRARSAARLIPDWLRWSGLIEWLKGAVLGSTWGSSKMAMHQGVRVINLNLAMVASHVWPHLAVIDGWRGMEGKGPSEGETVEWRVALAGIDPLAVDTVTADLMGFAPEEVGYLQYCRALDLGTGALERIELVGNVAPAEVRESFKPHPTYEDQLDWRMEGAERYLEPAPRGEAQLKFGSIQE
jgi:uncharacterized protein (DUF362 family)